MTCIMHGEGGETDGMMTRITIVFPAVITQGKKEPRLVQKWQWFYDPQRG